MRKWSFVGRSKSLVIDISLSFHPIWAKCVLACFCLRHAGGWGGVCVRVGDKGCSQARYLSRKFLKKLQLLRKKSPLYYCIIDFFPQKKINIKTDFETTSYIFAVHTSQAFPSPLRGAGGSCSAPSLPLWQTEAAAPAHCCL